MADDPNTTAGTSALRQVDLPAAEAQAWLKTNAFTDGLPVIAPERRLVDAAVDATGRSAGEVLGVLAPTFADVTIEKVVVCAVMAGCAPTAMRVVVACAEAMLASPFRVASVQASTSPATPLFVVSGPNAHDADMVDDTGAFGPGAGANFAIGRALRLLLLVVGGGHVGDGDPASLGMPAKLSACCAERIDASPWPSLAERRGCSPNDTAVIAFAITGMWQISEPTTNVDDVAHQVLHGMISPGQCSQPRLPQSGEQLLMVTPPIARLLAQRFRDVSDLQRALFEIVRIPMAWVPRYKREATRARLAELDIAWTRDLVPLAESPAAFEVIVTGGDAGVQSMGLSTLTLSRSAIAEVRGR